MNWRVLGLGTAVLWMVTVGVIVALFVQGHTRPGADGRKKKLCEFIMRIGK